MKQTKQTGTWDGQQIWREETAEETLLKHINLKPMNFKTIKEAEDYFKDNFTQSDDVDKEEARMERWLEEQTIAETEDVEGFENAKVATSDFQGLNN